MSALRLFIACLLLPVTALAAGDGLPFPGRDLPDGGGDGGAGVWRCDEVPPEHDCGAEGVCARGQTCQRITGAGCTCENATPHPCGVSLGESSEPTYVPRWMLPGFAFDIFNAGPAPNPLTPGNSLHLISANSIQVPVRHGSNWGGGFQTIAIPDQAISLDLQFTQFDANLPQMLHLNVTALSCTIPSFASVALSGGQTGTNAISLCQHSPFAGASYGWIDTTSGSIALYLVADLSNATLPAATPAVISALLYADVTGSTVTVRREDTDFWMWASGTHP